MLHDSVEGSLVDMLNYAWELQRAGAFDEGR